MSQTLYFRVVPGTLYEHLNISTYNSSPQFHANLTLNGVDLGVKAYPYGFTDYDGNAATQIDLYGIQIVETTFVTFTVDGHNYTEPAWYSAQVPDGSIPGSGSQPDLTASLSSAVENSGQTPTLSFAFTISNVGSANASGTPIAIYLSPTQTFNQSTAILVGAANGGALAASNSFVTTASNLNMPAGIQSRTYYAFVVADYDNSVADANLNNNVSNGVPISISINSPDQTLPISVSPSQVLGSLPQTISGTASVTYTFHVSQPFAFYSFLSGGSEFSGVLKALGGQLQNPTLGRGPGTPDPSGSTDQSTGATGFIYDPLMPGDYSYTVTRPAPKSSAVSKLCMASPMRSRSTTQVSSSCLGRPAGRR